MGGPDDTRGILNPFDGFRRFTLERQPPRPELAPWVDQYWVVRWQLAPGERYDQEVLPHPAVQIAFEAHGAAVHGVGTRRFVARLEGAGRVVGVKFLPGAFVAFSARPMADLVDRVLLLVDLFGVEAAALARRVADEPDAARAVVEVEAWLLGLGPRRDPESEVITQLCERVRADRSVTRVEELARLAGMSVRTLQRLFERYLGLGPKWVICRARVHEAAERVARGDAVDWAALALELGYHDQAHLIHEFKAQIGFTPAAYAARCAEAARRPAQHLTRPS